MDFDDDDFVFNETNMDIDFSSWKRCRVVSKQITDFPKFLKLNLAIDNYDEMTGSILIGFPWIDVKINQNDIIAVFGKYNEELQSFVVSNDFGLLVVNPDYLVSTTKVSQSLFCQRKAVLSEKFQIESSGSIHMVVGILVHEIFQKALFSMLMGKVKPDISQMTLDVTKTRDFAFKCYENLLNVEMAKQPLLEFSKNIKEFLATRIKNPLQENQTVNALEDDLHIDKIVDIEENVWSPQLGLKGKVDLTVHLHNRKKRGVCPFELKTGKTSTDHRAQTIMYITMMKHMNCDVDSGLLYYLRDNSISEVKENHNEVRDLIIARNEIVRYLTNYETVKNKLVKLDRYNCMELPTPLTRESPCTKCEFNFVCALYHNNSETKNPGNYPIQTIGEKMLNHLTEEDLMYFFKWADILSKEDKSLSEDEHFNELWTRTPYERADSGKAMINLILKTVVESTDGRLMHTFVSETSIELMNFEVGQYIIISTFGRIAITTGILSSCSEKHIEISLERNLQMQYPNELFIVDQYTSRNFLSFSFGNIALLMQNTPQANNLRNIIVKKIPPSISTKTAPIITKSVKLNEMQQNTVVNALNCENYVVVKGYAGTGKTETIVAIIDTYHKQNKSVLITSHTHSAVDNILLRLKKLELPFLRVGSMSRIRSELHENSDSVITKDCKQSSDFESTYAQYRIVGATCYGVTHPLFSRRIFDVCIVDEATQVTQPVIIRSLLCAKKFILVGDPYQLPPVIKSNEAKILGGDESLFCYLESLGESQELRTQYRMNRQIADLANAFTYNNKLLCVAVHQHIEDRSNSVIKFSWETRILSLSLTDSALFLDTGNAYERNLVLMKNKMFGMHMEKMSKVGHNLEPSKKLYFNLLEAVLIIHLISQFFKCGISSPMIGVIASYRSQVDCLKSLTKGRKQFNNLEINTVDQYQGRDKEFIIYSCTKTKQLTKENRNSNFVSNEILDDFRRLNVAITRAKRKLIVIGDYSSIQENNPFEKLSNCISSVRIPDSFYDENLTKLLSQLFFEKQ